MWHDKQVRRVDDDAEHNEPFVSIASVHWRTWGSARDSHPHSLTLKDAFDTRRDGMRVVRVVYWSNGEWRNALNKDARYVVVDGSSNFGTNLGTLSEDSYCHKGSE